MKLTVVFIVALLFAYEYNGYLVGKMVDMVQGRGRPTVLEFLK